MKNNLRFPMLCLVLALLIMPLAAAPAPTAKTHVLDVTTVLDAGYYLINGDTIARTISSVNADSTELYHILYLGSLSKGTFEKTEYAYAKTSDEFYGRAISDGMICVTKEAKDRAPKAKFTLYGEEETYDLFGYITVEGKEVYPCKFIFATPFQYGVAVVSWVENGKIYSSLIDKAGNYLVTVEAGGTTVFGDKYVCFRVVMPDGMRQYYCYNRENKFCGIMDYDTAYNCTIPGFDLDKYTKFVGSYGAQYDSVSYASNGNYLVKKDDTVKLVTSANKLIKAFEKGLSVKPVVLEDDKTVVFKIYKDINGEKGVTQADGTIIIEQKYKEILESTNNTFLARKGDSDQYILDYNGKQLARENSMIPMFTSAKAHMFSLGGSSFGTPLYIRIYLQSEQGIANISTANARKLLEQIPDSKVQKLEGTLLGEYRQAVATCKKDQAPCLVVWVVEGFLQNLIKTKFYYD